MKTNVGTRATFCSDVTGFDAAIRILLYIDIFSIFDRFSIKFFANFHKFCSLFHWVFHYIMYGATICAVADCRNTYEGGPIST